LPRVVDGIPTHEKVTGWLKPFVGVIVMPTVAVCPRWTVNVEALGHRRLLFVYFIGPAIGD
jgi:hypothetical protein